MKEAPEISRTSATSASGDLHHAVAAGFGAPIGDAADRVEAVRDIRGASRTMIGKLPVAAVLVEIARRLAADRRLHRRVDVAGRQAVARGARAVDVDLETSAGRAN